MGRRKDVNIYAMYKGEHIVAEGTLQDIAQCMGISYKKISWYTTPSAKKRLEKKELKHLPMRENEISVVLVEQVA